MRKMNAIEVSHLTKRFGDKVAVDDVSFTVGTGEVFGLLGPNGAGKTTTLRMITTLLKIDQGSVTIFGHDTAKEGRLARSMFGLTGQYASVDEDISARENLMIFSRLNGLSRAESKQRTTELLTEFSLVDSADKALKDFSGGMRRRLDLAVSLITRPALIFLDEPTTGLDPRTRTQMWDTIRKLVDQGSTIVLTTQYLDEADALADRIAVIDHGQLVKIGTPAELKQQVGGTTLTFTVDQPKQVATAVKLVTTQLKAVVQRAGQQLSVTLDQVAQLTPVLTALQQAKVAISHLTVQEPSLDDVFMDLTVGKN
ncbi:ATP-binding cassette domain-containing protein [Lactiplantibacillus mudanjiangensis]|uniref:ABC transporter ATP-binding protein [Lactobacillus allii] n=1 Tax=Lactiplantibacillus mudanjiangensis TaxID=1296538 RepID=A0A660E433_9LACO|nr:ATP-binding cassette domain-containing protein [Lactiplantibacillus mudanjiangensis]VDG17498.1 ABC transporter ATP-binding protein [Lactobacillus allii] [Lactiplantibacillus mudanjiangensis]VDG24676.1 ABC transporter ATP-binding protein [Lactobacillus allii] [Lactiplantibacillus mudanjiangensis]VDG27701.1 ABC transporter ATP-binding protein [Lactobacillus allii] [Lactiplantibacillus mudanjiangensis]VDG32822.1 ABC transporter ATP-binding protein [Lactobacillus allii] [Lactiplantibacillus muda